METITETQTYTTTIYTTTLPSGGQGVVVARADFGDLLIFAALLLLVFIQFARWTREWGRR